MRAKRVLIHRLGNLQRLGQTKLIRHLLEQIVDAICPDGLEHLFPLLCCDLHVIHEFAGNGGRLSASLATSAAALSSIYWFQTSDQEEIDDMHRVVWQVNHNRSSRRRYRHEFWMFNAKTSAVGEMERDPLKRLRQMKIADLANCHTLILVPAIDLLKSPLSCAPPSRQCVAS